MRVRKALASPIKFTALTVQWAYTFALYFDEPSVPSAPALPAVPLQSPASDPPLHPTAAG